MTEIECYLPGSTTPVSIEVYSAWLRARMEADRKSGSTSVDLPDVYDYSPPIDSKR